MRGALGRCPAVKQFVGVVYERQCVRRKNSLMYLLTVRPPGGKITGPRTALCVIPAHTCTWLRPQLYYSRRVFRRCLSPKSNHSKTVSAATFMMVSSEDDRTPVESMDVLASSVEIRQNRSSVRSVGL